MRIDVRRVLPGHVGEQIELAFELPPHRSKVAEIGDLTARREAHVKADA